MCFTLILVSQGVESHHVLYVCVARLLILPLQRKNTFFPIISTVYRYNTLQWAAYIFLLWAVTSLDALTTLSFRS